MTTELLKKLKRLDRIRERTSPFSGHLEFERWSDEFVPLLSLNEKLQNSFKHYTKIAIQFKNQLSEYNKRR